MMIMTGRARYQYYIPRRNKKNDAAHTRNTHDPQQVYNKSRDDDPIMEYSRLYVVNPSYIVLRPSFSWLAS